MYNEPRNWKWMVPATLVVVMMIAWNWTMAQGWTNAALLPLGVGAIFALAAVINLWRYVRAFTVQDMIALRKVENETPEVLLFQAAQKMHPQAVDSLLIHRRAIWRIKYIPQRDLVDWILDEAPTVHAGFVDFVLDNSSEASVMPQNFLSEGSKRFDPEGRTLDRDQYMDLMLLWQGMLICTKPLGNQAGKWLRPWTPELVRHRFGLDGEMYVETPLPSASPQIQSADLGGGDDLERTQMMKVLTDSIRK